MGNDIDGPSTQLFVAAVFLLFAVFFLTVDAGVRALGRAELRVIHEGQKQLFWKTAGRLAEDWHRALARIFFARSLCFAGAAIFAAQYFEAQHIVVSGLGTVIGLLGVVVTDSVVGGVIAGIVRRRARDWSLQLYAATRVFEAILQVVSTPLSWVTRKVISWVDPQGESSERVITEAQLEDVIDQGEESGTLSQEHAKMLRSVLEFKDTVAHEVMVPRTQVVAFEISTNIDEILGTIVEKGHSRYPVYRDKLDQVEGLLYVKDLLRALRDREENIDLARVIRRSVYFVPESKKIGALLREMQARRFHLSVVIDEFGGTSGIVTLEDILEEIVGEIRDEHDNEVAPVRRLGPGRFVANASVSVYDLQDYIGAKLPETSGSYDSLGGLLVDVAGGVPEVGQSVVLGSLEFTVEEADKRRIMRVQIKEKPVESSEQQAAS